MTRYMPDNFGGAATEPSLVYTAWAVQKPKVIKALLAYQTAVMVIGSLALSWSFAVIVIPLAAFSIAVLAYATNRYARDGDWLVIHEVFGANLRDIVNIIRSDDQISQCYGMDAEDKRRLAHLAARPEALTAVQELFAGHRIIGIEPKTANKKMADVVLLLLGAIVGGLAQARLGAPKGYHPIWTIDVGEFIKQDWHRLIVMPILILCAVSLSYIGNRRMAGEQRLLKQYAVERPISLLTDTFAAVPEVRQKVRDAARWASKMSTVDSTSVQALEGVTGTKILKVGHVGTALGDIQWTILMFDLGIVLGVTLPPMLGIG